MTRFTPPTASQLLLLAATALLTVSTQAQSAASPRAASMTALRRGFADPPAASRPMVRWWWFGVAVEKPEILRELQQMKADGLGGAELAFVYPQVVDDPANGLKNLPFLSPGMLDAIRFAQTEARKLGLRVDVTLCSGWPFGGPATTLDEAAGRLRIVELAIAPNGGSIELPPLAAGETLIAAFAAHGAPGRWDPASARPLSTPLAARPSTFFYLRPRPSARPITALFFIASHTGQQVKRAAVGAEGYVLDPFSQEAVSTHLRAVGEPLLSAFGTTPPFAIFSDSLEAYGADWTPSLLKDFRNRRGYDLVPHLPELAAGGSVAADTVRHDFGRTLTELVDANYLTQINRWAAAHHTRFRSQTYGEPAVSLASQRLVDLPEGEGSQWRAFSTLRWATSANHLFGNPITSGETFTWLHSPVFRATPLDMKAEADVDFLTGENLLIFHGWPYSPPTSSGIGEPGWSLYAAAVFNDHNPWHPVMPAVTRYLARVSFLLQQGEPANQVAILLPTDDAWASFSPGKATVSGAMTRLVPPALVNAVLSAGYNFDFIDADTINRLGLHHTILLLPPTDRIPLVTLRKIRDFVAAGGKAIAVGRTPSIDDEGGSAQRVSSLSRSLFNPATQTFVPDVSTLAAALHHAATPDLSLSSPDTTTSEAVGFIRRRLPGADLYFLANTSSHPVTLSAHLATTHRFAEAWDPDTGTTTAASASAALQSLDLAPYESRVLVFSDQFADQRPPAQRRVPTKSSAAAQRAPERLDLSHDWLVTFPALTRSATEVGLKDWTADPATLHFSGEAVYARSVDLATAPTGPVWLHIEGGTPVARPALADITADHDPVQRAPGAPLPNPLKTGVGPGMQAWFDPPLREAALVVINGQAAGALWHPPYRLDVAKLLHAGSNRIELHVFNTALNAWSALSPHDYRPLIAIYGDRFQMQDLDKVRPLPSGLLGAVHLELEAPIGRAISSPSASLKPQ